jgi:hypothetical protein
MATKNLCQDCNEIAIGKTVIIWARGAQAELVYFCTWHKSLYKVGA